MSSGIGQHLGRENSDSLGPESLACVWKKSSARMRYLMVDLIARLMTACGARTDFIFI